MSHPSNLHANSHVVYGRGHLACNINTWFKVRGQFMVVYELSADVFSWVKWWVADAHASIGGGCFSRGGRDPPPRLRQ